MQRTIGRLRDFSQRDVCEQDQVCSHMHEASSPADAAADAADAAAADAPAAVAWREVYGEPQATRDMP